MLTVRIDQRTILSAILSVGMAFGCGSEQKDDGILSSDEKISLRKEGQKAAESAHYPQCGPEVPFSLVLTGTYDGAALDQSLAVNSSQEIGFPASIYIWWGDSEFIHLAWQNWLPEDPTIAEDYWVEGSLLLGSDRSEIDAILNGSYATLQQKISELYLRTANGEIIGVLCNNQ
jgi:hypothetical protein